MWFGYYGITQISGECFDKEDIREECLSLPIKGICSLFSQYVDIEDKIAFLDLELFNKI